MCEFKVFLEGKEIFQDVIYAKLEGRDLILRDVMGETLRIPGSRIVEMDVSSAKLVIESS
ncbi:MAG: CooT family nickel-binding protein [Candidatus Bathyarchaeia archaeon]